MILILDTSTENSLLAIWAEEKVEKVEWLGGRELSSTIFIKLDELFKKSNKKIEQLKGIIVNSGPGSFTGLRIGISAANAIAFSLNIPIVGVSNSSDFEQIFSQGKEELKDKKYFEKSIEPFYGAEPNITKPKN